MRYLATMALDLICLLRFPPAGGHDPQELAEIGQAWWRIVAEDLALDEKAQFLQAAMDQVTELKRFPLDALPPEALARLDALERLVESGTIPGAADGGSGDVCDGR
jgi:hypothetical protein